MSILQIPDVSELLANVSSLLESNIKEDVAAGLEVFSGIKKTVDQHIPRVQEAITETGMYGRPLLREFMVVV